MRAIQKRFFDKKYDKSTADVTPIRRAILATPFTIDTSKVADLFHRLDLEHSLVLDVGSGDQSQCYLFAPDSTCSIIGLDFSQPGLKIAQNRAQTLNYKGTFTPVLSDALSLPFKTETFHAVMHSMVLEHTENPPQAIREAARVLKPGGKLFLVTINKNHMFRGIYKRVFCASYDETFCHSDEHFFTMEQLKGWFEENRLDIEEELYFYSFISPIWDVYVVPKLIKLGVANNKTGIQLLKGMKILIAKLAIMDKIFKRAGNSSCLALVGRKTSY